MQLPRRPQQAAEAAPDQPRLDPAGRDRDRQRRDGRPLMHNPLLTLLDEPSAGLAPLIVAEIVEVVRGLKHEGLAILLVEQNLGAAPAIGDRNHVMDKGAICFTGTAAELTGNDAVLRNYLSV